ARCDVCYYFFFSSRRRHTSFSRDWSSDVCSSDLGRWESGQRLNSSGNRRGSSRCLLVVFGGCSGSGSMELSSARVLTVMSRLPERSPNTSISSRGLAYDGTREPVVTRGALSRSFVGAGG